MSQTFRVYVCLFVYLLNGSQSQDYNSNIKSPASHFPRHSLVQPVVQHGRTKREILSATHEEGLYHPELTMKLNLDGEEIILDLVLNKDLISKNHAIVYQKNGSILTYKPSIEEMDICQYTGKVRGKKDSWVALSTCHGVRGVIHDGKQMKHIEPAQVTDPQIGSKHYVYDQLDLTTTSHCGYQDDPNHLDHGHELLNDHIKGHSTSHRQHKRGADNDTEVRGPFKVDKKSRFVELVLVADNAVYKANGENIQSVHKQMKDIANIMNSLYAPLNIFITLVGIEIWTEDNKISISENGDRTLTNFLRYRRERLNSQIPNDNAQLLTMQRFSDGVIGKFLKGTICTSEFSGGVAMNNSEVIGLIAIKLAHGLAHNFGVEHDIGPCECPDDRCIMDPTFGSIAPTRWSRCSREYFTFAFDRGLDHCLRNKPKRLFDPPTCGNGFVERGEQCDCGLRPDPACAACCEAETCTLRSNATCASGECCDTRTCKLQPASTVCRSAESDCDLPEYCSGDSEFCPKDVYKMDATPCANNQAYCVQGSCRTHEDQCRLLWGSMGFNSDALCYDNNVKGNRRGNCGVTRVAAYEKLYNPCALEDVQCGLLHCRHYSERLEYGMESVSILSATFINSNGSIIPCRTAIIDLGTQDVDPGLVPDGAKCGDNKMCLKQKCVSVLAVREQMSRRESSVCPSDCFGHGVCNSEGHCHCDAGYGPPLCAEPGAGGSIDSGPAQPHVELHLGLTGWVWNYLNKTI